MTFYELYREIENEYKDSYQEIVQSGIYKDPLNYYLVCVYPVKSFSGKEKPEPRDMFANFNREVALYFHIPFCKTLCSFCNFHIHVNSKETFVEEYLRALKQEAHLVKQSFDKGDSKPIIHSVYIGGGTPTYLKEEQIDYLINKVIYENFHQWFPNKGLVELTMESSPGTLTYDKLLSLKRLGVNRISIGVQTFHDEVLKLMKRYHDHDTYQAFQAINWLKEIFGECFNIDLLPGLPINKDQKRDFFFLRLYEDLQYVIKEEIPSVTFYHLWTRWMDYAPMIRMIQNGEWVLPSTEEVTKIWIMINKILNRAGYMQNPAGWFIKSDNATFKQQIFKWNEKHEYLGLGVSAYGYFNGHIYWNLAASNLGDRFTATKHYIKCVQDGQFPYDKIRRLTSEEIDRTKAVFSIKTKNGLNLKKLQNPNLFDEEIAILEHLGLVKKESSVLNLTSKGYIFFDEISEFFFDPEDRNAVRRKLDYYTIIRNKLNFIIRRCISTNKKQLQLVNTNNFKHEWNNFLIEKFFPSIKDTLEFYFQRILGSKFQRFLIVYLYTDEKGKAFLLTPYYSKPNRWYTEAISPWFQSKLDQADAIPLSDIIFNPPTGELLYFPPVISFSLEIPAIHEYPLGEPRLAPRGQMIYI